MHHNNNSISDDNNRIQIKRNSLDYLNASFVSDPISNRNYILTQVIT